MRRTISCLAVAWSWYFVAHKLASVPQAPALALFAAGGAALIFLIVASQAALK